MTGSPAITCRKVGKGRVIYVGTYLMRDAVEGLLPMLVEWSDLQPLCPGAPSGVEVTVRQNKDKQVWFLLNHSTEEVAIASAPAGEDLITGKPCNGQLVLPRNGVAVIQK